MNETGSNLHISADPVPSALTLDRLIRAYETDPDSPLRKLRYSTKENYRSLTSRLSDGHDAVRKSATHSNASQTQAYSRGDADDIADVMKMRAASRGAA